MSFASYEGMTVKWSDSERGSQSWTVEGFSDENNSNKRIGKDETCSSQVRERVSESAASQAVRELGIS